MAGGEVMVTAEYHRWWNATRRDKEKQAAYYAAWYRRNKKKRDLSRNQEHVRNWRKENPLATNAHGAVRRALASGRLVKPESCEVCLITGKKLTAHHPNYAEPLRVVWVCYRCHKRWHVGAL